MFDPDCQVDSIKPKVAARSPYVVSGIKGLLGLSKDLACIASGNCLGCDGAASTAHIYEARPVRGRAFSFHPIGTNRLEVSSCGAANLAYRAPHTAMGVPEMAAKDARDPAPLASFLRLLQPAGRVGVLGTTACLCLPGHLPSGRRFPKASGIQHPGAFTFCVANRSTLPVPFPVPANRMRERQT